MPEMVKPVWINTCSFPDYKKELQPGWDGYGGRVPTDEAINTAKHMALVPGGDGSLQFEIHAGGSDVEIHIGPNGIIDYIATSNPETEIFPLPLKI